MNLRSIQHFLRLHFVHIALLTVLLGSLFALVSSRRAPQHSGTPSAGGDFDWAALAVGYYDQRDYDQAESCWLKAMRGGQDSADMWYDLGNTYFMEGKYDKAVHAYFLVLQLDPKDQDAQFNLGLAQKRLQEEATPGFQEKEQARQLTLLMRKLNVGQ